ncbi:MAG: poly-gamma-glutamate synthase PgsB [Cellvibrionales bacterium]|nr:poly-gamma-glutamate synthase PgsB [Cellvibrionales bacterium]
MDDSPRIHAQQAPLNLLENTGNQAIKANKKSIIRTLNKGRNTFWQKIDKRRTEQLAEAILLVLRVKGMTHFYQDRFERLAVSTAIAELTAVCEQNQDQTNHYLAFKQSLETLNQKQQDKAIKHFWHQAPYTEKHPLRLRMQFKQVIRVEALAQAFSAYLAKNSQYQVYLINQLTRWFERREGLHQGFQEFADWQLTYAANPSIPLPILRAMSESVSRLAHYWCSSGRVEDLAGFFDNTASSIWDEKTPYALKRYWLDGQIIYQREVFIHRLPTYLTYQGKDRMYLVAHVVRVVCQSQDVGTRELDFLMRVCQDSSAYVRQSLLQMLPVLPEDVALTLFAQAVSNEKSLAVQVTALQQLALINSVTLQDQCLQTLLHHFIPASDRALQLLAELLPKIYAHNIALASDVASADLPLAILDKYCVSNLPAAIQSAGDQAKAILWLQSNPLRIALFDTLTEAINAQKINKPIRLALAQWESLSEQDKKRVLALVADQGFPLELKQTTSHWIITKGHRLGFRLWRWLHECFHARTDKREGVSHWTGRVFYTLAHFPSRIMAERSSTAVPGEPCYIDKEDSWRPWLPLVDECISVLDQSWPTKPLQIYTSTGVTELLPPSNVFKRLQARLFLTVNFAKVATLRNHPDSLSLNDSPYVETLNSLGFGLTFRGYPTQSSPDKYTPESHKKAKPKTRAQALVSIGLGSSLIVSMESYFFSVYANEVFHLVLFLAAMCLLFVGRQLSLSWQFRRFRRAIPLVIGGWGSRGKSGVERLKSALFQGQGLSVLSKTTGCEAVMLSNIAFEPLKEIPLFRPFDKASIWEQMQVVTFASRLKADVFLWECMGLTPAYIKVLQKDWMRDDLSTITNCFPDHEDLQGPAGMDVAEVISEFTPENSHLLTSEREMLPLLKEKAKLRKTQLVAVPALASHLITDDILAAFPYEEHPANIALVLTLAKTLAIPQDIALYDMSHQVHPDVGVLHRFMPVTINHRTIHFINGFSANERYATLQNWQRMAMNQPFLSQRQWVVGLINNRADRSARSQVFAKLLAQDLSADQYVVIGSNTKGFIKHAERAYAEKLSNLFEGAPLKKIPNLVSTEWAWLKQPVSRNELAEKLALIADHLGMDALVLRDILTNEAAFDEKRDALNTWFISEDNQKAAESIKHFIEKKLMGLSKVESLLSALLTATDNKKTEIEALCKQALMDCFVAKFVVLEKTSALILWQSLYKQLPAGVSAEIMGLQNIKGAALDFLLWWREAENTLNEWQGLPESEISQKVDSLIKAQRHTNRCNPILYAMLQNHYPDAVGDCFLPDSQRMRGNESTLTFRVIAMACHAVESVMDAAAAVSRRRRVDQYYEAWMRGRIDDQHLKQQLREVIDAQSGGWLFKRFQQYLSKNHRG